MAGKSNTWAQAVTEFLFQATFSAVAGVGQNAASPLTNIYVSLHTADPLSNPATGTQSTSEAAYTSYARVAVARTTGGWTISGQAMSPAATISFATATGGSETETYMGIGAASTSGTAAQMFYSGAISPNIAVTTGVTPQLTSSTTITES